MHGVRTGQTLPATPPITRPTPSSPIGVNLLPPTAWLRLVPVSIGVGVGIGIGVESHVTPFDPDTDTDPDGDRTNARLTRVPSSPHCLPRPPFSCDPC